MTQEEQLRVRMLRDSETHNVAMKVVKAKVFMFRCIGVSSLILGLAACVAAGI